MRKNNILDLLISDIATFYLPTTILPPLQVDENKEGKDSDHAIIFLHLKHVRNLHKKE